MWTYTGLRTVRPLLQAARTANQVWTGDTVRDTVRTLAEGLQPGESRSGLVCPKCEGGTSRDRSFSVWRDETGIGFKCHRSKCGIGGVRPTLPGGPLAHERPSFIPRPYPHALITPPINHEIWDRLRVPVVERNSYSAAHYGVGAREDFLREIVWEVRGYDYETRGHVSRVYPGKQIRSWKIKDLPWVGYMGWTRSDKLYIVEDMLSAASIMREGGNAIALLGTHFSAKGRQELKDYLQTRPNTKVHVALDPDASTTGAVMARELTFILGRDILFVPLKLDPKDMEPGELREIIHG